MTTKMKKSLVALAVGATFAASGAVMATTLTWDSSASSPTAPVDGSGTWNTTGTNWSTGTTDSSWGTSGGYSTTASFGSNNGAAGTVTLGANITAAGLTFNPATSGDYTIAGSGSYVLELTGGGAATGASIVANANATISAGTYFYNGVSFTGSSQLTLSGPIHQINGNFPVNFSGDVTVNINTNLNAGSSSYMSWAAGGSVVNINNNATFTAPFLFEIGNNTGATTININSGGVMANTGQYLFGYAGGNGTTVNVSAGAQMQAYQIELGQTVPGVLNLNGGLINADWIHTNNTVGGTLNLNGGTLEAFGEAGPNGLYSTWIESTAADPMTVNVLNGGVAFEVPTNYKAVVSAALLQGTNADGTSSTGGITITGGGTLVLTGNNTFTGPTVIQAGTLALTGGSAPTSIADSSVLTINASGVFDISATNATPTVLKGLSLNSGTITFGMNGGQVSNILVNNAASINGTNTINVYGVHGATAFTYGTYNLISDTAGGLTGNFVFGNGTDTANAVLGTNSYLLTLSNSDTAEMLTVSAVPEPATLGLFTVGGLALMLIGRKRKTQV